MLCRKKEDTTTALEGKHFKLCSQNLHIPSKRNGMKLENYTVPGNENKEKDGSKGIIKVTKRCKFKTREKTEKESLSIIK